MGRGTVGDSLVAYTALLRLIICGWVAAAGGALGVADDKKEEEEEDSITVYPHIHHARSEYILGSGSPPLSVIYIYIYIYIYLFIFILYLSLYIYIYINIY